VVLPSCPPSFAQVVGERIRAKVESLEIASDEHTLKHVTVSCGGAYAPPWLRSTVAAWITHADEQMYRAKTSGRNKVCLAPMHFSEVSAEEKSMLFGLSDDNDLMMGDPTSP
jgi:diguanylate cyclase (GGDEF)-like protein